MNEWMNECMIGWMNEWRSAYWVGYNWVDYFECWLINFKVWNVSRKRRKINAQACQGVDPSLGVFFVNWYILFRFKSFYSPR